MTIELLQGDCMDYMRTIKNKHNKYYIYLYNDSIKD